MAIEIELKLDITQTDIPALEQCSLLQNAAPPVVKNYGNTYFDTPNLDLNSKKIALRVRDTGNGLVQTVKCATESKGGLSARPEWECEYQGHFDFSNVEMDEVRAYLTSINDNLAPMFSTNFVRKIWYVLLPEETSIQVMLDVGQVTSGTKNCPISEVELELTSGSTDQLIKFAEQLKQCVSLTPSDVSKAERGFALTRR